MQRLTTEEVIRRAKEAHGERYSYDAMVYVDAETKVKIRCSKHGLFEQRPHHHFRGQGCRECLNETRRITNEEAISQARAIYGNRYGYSLIDVKDSDSSITVICPVHNEVATTYKSFIYEGRGCIQCSEDERTMVNVQLSSFQRDVLIGSMLGDGHLSAGNPNKDGIIGDGQNSRFIVARSIKDTEYLKWEFDLFKEFCVPGFELMYSDSSDICKVFKEKSKVRFQTRSLPVFSKFRKEWYDDNKVKIVPSSLQLTPLSIAIWFADDGSICVYDGKRMDMRIHTNGFTPDEVRFLISLLQDRYNEQFHLNFTTQENGNRQPIIRCGNAAAIPMFIDIDSVFPQSMKRKSDRWRKFLLGASSAS